MRYMWHRFTLDTCAALTAFQTMLPPASTAGTQVVHLHVQTNHEFHCIHSILKKKIYIYRPVSEKQCEKKKLFFVLLRPGEYGQTNLKTWRNFKAPPWPVQRWGSDKVAISSQPIKEKEAGIATGVEQTTFAKKKIFPSVRWVNKISLNIACNFFCWCPWKKSLRSPRTLHWLLPKPRKAGISTIYS